MTNHNNTIAPICDTPLQMPDNATVVTTLAADFIGQEITVECWEGFEFADSPVPHSGPGDTRDIVTLGNTGNIVAAMINVEWLISHIFFPSSPNNIQ